MLGRILGWLFVVAAFFCMGMYVVGFILTASTEKPTINYVEDRINIGEISKIK